MRASCSSRIPPISLRPADVSRRSSKPTAHRPEPVPARVSAAHEAVPIAVDAACGRDDRGQEATIDADAALTLAPAANVEVRYDEVCVRGSEGTLALQRALDDPNVPNVIVFPFAVGPTYDT